MLKFFKKKSKQPISPQKETSLLDNAPNQKSLYELKHLVCVTQENYQQLYIDLLQRVTDDRDIDNFNEKLALAIAVLKHRRAYMLPLGSNAETCYQQQDVWTYALFTAVLFKDYGQVTERFNSASQLLPKKGMQWINRYPDLLKSWRDYLEDAPPTTNIIAAVVQKTEDDLLNKPQIPVQDGIAALLYPTTHTEEILTQPTSPSNVVEADKTTCQTEIGVAKNNEDSPIKEESDIDQPEEQLLAYEFINWIKQAVTQKQLVLNFIEELEYGPLHHVTEGILLVMPDLWDEFIIHHPEIIEEWPELTESGQIFINNQKGNFIHAYCIGDWHLRHVIKGLLVKPTQLFAPDKLPPINTALTPDPSER
jgi:hypothetical protein